MPGYGIGILPLLTAVQHDNNQTEQAAFADDLAGLQKLRNLLVWWKNIAEIGPMLGFYPKPSKSSLIVTPEILEEAILIFSEMGVNVTTSGHAYLGGFIGSQEGKVSYSTKLTNKWIEQLLFLCDIAKTEPHAAYSVFISWFRHKLSYHIRVIKDINIQLEAFDEIVQNRFIPAIIGGRQVSDDERVLLSLPVRLGGMAIPIFATNAPFEYENLEKIMRSTI